MDKDLADLNIHRGQVNAYEDLLGLCDYLDRMKVASKEEEEKFKAMAGKQEPFQAVIEGKTTFRKEDLDY